MFRNVAAVHAGGCAMLAKRSGDQPLQIIGSAFLCHSKGYMLTAAHPINLTDQLCVVFPPPVNQFNPATLTTVTFVPITVAQFDADNDIALLKLYDVTVMLPPNLFGSDNQVPVGATISYLGFPHSHIGQHALKVSGGVLSAKVISPKQTKQFQFDAMVEAGNSGGPLIDVATNQIIGVVSGRFSPTGPGGGIRMGSHALGTESTISFATAISYGLQLMAAEGL